MLHPVTRRSPTPQSIEHSLADLLTALLNLKPAYRRLEFILSFCSALFNRLQPKLRLYV